MSDQLEDLCAPERSERGNNLLGKPTIRRISQEIPYNKKGSIEDFSLYLYISDSGTSSPASTE